MDKLITVVIPTFNRKELTDVAVHSVVSSYASLLEIIVIDDCGSIPYFFTDSVNVSGVAVRCVRLQVNVGPGMARKVGVEEANGEYIAFLDSDDSYDQGWMDYVISELRSKPQLQNCHLMISGISNGERPTGAAVRRWLASLPTSLVLVGSRLMTTLFNPFYTPSIILHKDLCVFKDNLRHCEDYYSTMLAVFKADLILLPQVVACHLGREPNSDGGVSAAKEKMHKGEMKVRRAMLSLPCVPFLYKLLVPIGMLYQLARTAVKRLFA